ncbi:peptidoglycan-binding protein [Streptomyces sp. NPDC051913]|uniref:peptidoglycan-binding protein n=1 Tax=Streptomyces sp. NPDC051913 TaxID=3365676 RepID=UPI0037D3EE1F
MSLRTAATRAATAAVGSLTAVTLAMSASPASAAYSDGYVRGYGIYGDDWGDEGGAKMSNGGGWNESNAVCLWQKILWAEGANETNGTNFDAADVTGYFGDNTEHGTRELQARWGLTVDGLVGNNTFGRADKELRVTGGSDDSGEQLNMTYDGDLHSFSVVRNSEGKYSFRDGDDTWRIAGYNYRTCS